MGSSKIVLTSSVVRSFKFNGTSNLMWGKFRGNLPSGSKQLTTTTLAKLPFTALLTASSFIPFMTSYSWSTKTKVKLSSSADSSKSLSHVFVSRDWTIDHRLHSTRLQEGRTFWPELIVGGVTIRWTLVDSSWANCLDFLARCDVIVGARTIRSSDFSSSKLLFVESSEKMLKFYFFFISIQFKALFLIIFCSFLDFLG